jgi:hypothetical protein
MKMNDKELIREAYAIGYCGDCRVDVEALADEHNVSDEVRQKMMESFEEGNEDS